ncbi:MAG: tetratricopeptide repeat protein [Ktedonobacteraceae bacterium]|nr:tetratricopeptide repeat protein [Ktedonobacteraceae bacterium]
MSILSPSRAITIFVSYANTCPKDSAWFNKFDKHLSLLFPLYPTLQYYDSRPSDKSPTTQLIEARLNQADLIILLISVDFFASKQYEMQRALALKDAEKAYVVPVLLRPTNWNVTPLSQYRPLPSDGRPVSRWPNSDAAFTDIVQEIHKIIEKIASQESRSAQSSPQSILLYDPPNAYDNLFTDREYILNAISSFFTSARTGRTALLALSGLGGVGKTSIAKEYCDTCATKYQDILWFNASSRMMLSTYAHTLADQLSLPAAVRENEAQFFAAVKQWLQERPRWLLVLDQIQDITLVDLIVPRSSSGHVLLTTRIYNTGKRAFALFVPSMDTDAGALFLLRRTQTLSAQAPLEQASEEVIEQAREIARALDGFPLALDQAGAYLQESGGGLASYLTLYKQQGAYLLSKGGQAEDNQYAAVTEILAPTLDALQNTPEMELLHLLSFLHPDVILEGLLVKGARALHEPLRSLVANPLALHEALGKLHNSCLVRYRANGTVLQIQRIIQDVLIARLTTEQQIHWAKQAVRLVNHAFPEVRFDTRAVCERYLPQAEHCAMLISNFHLTLKEGTQFLERLGFFCLQRASYGDAERYLLQALHLYERRRSANTLNIAQALNSLGLLYHQQARYKEAEERHQQALELRERVRGPDDPKTVESLHNLAMIYGDLGKYREAERLYRRVLSLEERTKGPDHPDVADTLNELGLTYTQQGRVVEAETAYRRAFTIYEHSRDANHPDLTYPLDGLGTLAEQQGDYQQAERLYQQAFAICKQAFGEIHPETAHSINKLAGIAASQNDYERAEILYQQALSIYEQKLGPRHPDVALVLNDWGLQAAKQRQYEKAREFYERALSIYELALGPEHPDVASVLNNLGQLSYETGDKERAKTFLQRSLAIREKAFNATHPAIAQSLSNLANLQNNE